MQRKYVILLAGYVLIWGTYFGIRAYQYQSREVAPAVITRILWGRFSIDAPHHSAWGLTGGEDQAGEYQCPEVRFYTRVKEGDTWFVTSNESYATSTHTPGEHTRVIFPRGYPEKAVIYSVGEFWFSAPYMVLLGVLTVFWSIGFYAVAFIFMRPDEALRG